MINSRVQLPKTTAGVQQRIELAGVDLWIRPRIDNLFVYTTELNIDRLQHALRQTLGLWPVVAGHFLVLDEHRYFIETSDDQGIPFTFVTNTELKQWPHGSNVILNDLQPFLDPVLTDRFLKNDCAEPLFRIKITRLAQSNEWIIGTSWAHILGDAFTCFQFLHTLSCFYQEISPPSLTPIFDRPLWSADQADPSLLPNMKHLSQSVSADENLRKTVTEQVTHEQINMHFSGDQLQHLRSLLDDQTLTMHDAMIAYIICTLNRYCFDQTDHIILHTNLIVNYRGVSNAIAPVNLMANCTLRVISDNFDDPYSLLSIARSIRQSIIRSRDAAFLQSSIATADGLMRDLAKNHREVNIDPFPHGIIVNSNFRYDWARGFDLGQTDRCRFYTDGTANLFLRVFHRNPVYDGTKWLERDPSGAEVVFRLEKSVYQNFIDAWQRDIYENFSRVKL